MQQDVIDESEDAVSFEITGVLEPYKYTSALEFTDESTLVLNITMLSQTTGGEIVTIYFDTDLMKSTDNANLTTSQLEGDLNKIPIIPDVVSVIGTGIGSAMSATIVILIVANMAMGGSSELMWGFMNTIQIIYFFPLLNLYYPDHLASLLTYFASAKLQIPIPGISYTKDRVKSEYLIEEKINMPALNYRYESIEYESTSLILNAEDIFTVFTQGIVACIIIYALKAILFTLRSDTLDVYQKELDQLNLGVENTPSKIAWNPRPGEKSGITETVSKIGADESSERPKNEKMQIWVRKKIREMSAEYKYNFFLRLGIELFLEAFILALLNIRHPVLENVWQYISFLVSSLVLVALIAFFCWSLNFSCKHFYKFKGKPKFDMEEYSSMFGEYKTDNLPQALFNTYFMARRMLYGCIIIFLPAFPLMQAFTFMIICVPIFAYHIVMSPYLDNMNNVMMSINEAMLLVIGCFFYIFSEPMQDGAKSFLLGWVVIAIILCVICLNIVIVWILKLLSIFKEIREWWRARKDKVVKKKTMRYKLRKQSNYDMSSAELSSPQRTRSSVLEKRSLKQSQFYKINSSTFKMQK